MRRAILASSPLLVLAIVAGLLACRTLGPDGATVKAAGSGSDSTAADATVASDIVAYAALCRTELGITKPFPPMNCLDGTEVPITFGGQRLTSANWAAFEAGGRKCDAPQWLQFGCWPYDLVQRIDLGPDVEAVLNCRQKYFTPGMNGGMSKDERAAAYLAAPPDKKAGAYDFLYRFDDLGMVLKNRKSGKVCYLGLAGDYFGGRVPPPDEAALPEKTALRATLREPKPPAGSFSDALWYRGAREVYMSPASAASNGCIRCHDAGGFKHTPFIDGTDVVPSNHSKSVPYLLVGAVFQKQVTEFREVTTDPIAGAPQVCTQCHRIPARMGTCSQFLAWSTGKLPPGLLDLMTEHGKALPAVAWMPAGHDLDTPAAFAAAYGGHLSRIQCCCQNPDFLGCKSRKYGPTAADVETAWAPGAGPGSCLQ